MQSIVKSVASDIITQFVQFGGAVTRAAPTGPRELHAHKCLSNRLKEKPCVSTVTCSAQITTIAMQQQQAVEQELMYEPTDASPPSRQLDL